MRPPAKTAFGLARCSMAPRTRCSQRRRTYRHVPELSPHVPLPPLHKPDAQSVLQPHGPLAPFTSRKFLK